MRVSPDVETALFSLLVVALVVCAVLRVRFFLFLCGFLIPLTFPRLQVGFGVDWYKVLGPFALVMLVINFLRGAPVFRTRVPGIRWLVVYCLAVSTVWMVIEYNWLQRWRMAEAMNMGAGLAQTLYKMPVQLGSFVGQVLCAYIIPAWAADESDARAGIWGYGAGCAASVAVGLVGTALFGSGTLNMSVERGLLAVGTTDFSRLGGMTGEPKFLGACLATLLSLLLAALLFASDEASRRSRIPIFAGLAAMFMTFSSSAWAALLAATGVGALMGLQRWRSSRVGWLLVVLAVGALVTMSVSVVAVMLEQRFVERLFVKSAELKHMKDAYVFYAFFDDPWNAFFGYGLGGGDFAVIPYVEWMHLKYQRTPTPSLTGPRILGDLGLFGLGLLLMIGRRWFGVLESKQQRMAAAFVFMGMTSVLLSSLIATSAYFFLMGGLLALANLRVAESEPAAAPAAATVVRRRAALSDLNTTHGQPTRA